MTDKLMFTSLTSRGVVRSLVSKSEIFLVKSETKCLIYYTQSTEHIGYGSLTALEASWGEDWIRVNKNAFVRKAAILAIASGNADIELTLQFGSRMETVRVSRRLAPEVRKLFKLCK